VKGIVSKELLEILRDASANRSLWDYILHPSREPQPETKITVGEKTFTVSSGSTVAVAPLKTGTNDK
jgi:hypothetical protein